LEEDPPVPKACSVCGKTASYGHKVSHAHNVTHRRWEPNLQRVHAIVKGVPRTIRVCTRCLRSGKVLKNVRAPRAESSAA
jgi:large subunit ribosomal protein L28